MKRYSRFDITLRAVKVMLSDSDLDNNTRKHLEMMVKKFPNEDMWVLEFHIPQNDGSTKLETIKPI